MFERFRRSWELTKQSAAVLAKDKVLMLFPLMSGAATIVSRSASLCHCS
jgi:hypothetical protein